MEIKHQKIVDRLLQECSELESFSPTKKRYTNNFKQDIRLLFQEGLSRKKILKLIPISVFSFEKWIRPNLPLRGRSLEWFYNF